MCFFSNFEMSSRQQTHHCDDDDDDDDGDDLLPLLEKHSILAS